MPTLGHLGACSADLLAAEASIRDYTKAYCDIMGKRAKPCGLPPYIQPPKNSVRWQPGKDQPLTIPAVPVGADLLVWSERMPTGYDGLIVQFTNIWNGTGFVEGSGDITWRVRIDRRFVPYYDNILETMSNLAVIPSDVVGQGIPIVSNQLIQLFANFAVGSDARLNPGGMTICAATGYIWPRERLEGL